MVKSGGEMMVGIGSMLVENVPNKVNGRKNRKSLTSNLDGLPEKILDVIQYSKESSFQLVGS